MVFPPFCQCARDALRSGLRASRDDGQVGTSLRRTGALHDVKCRDWPPKAPQLQVSEVLESRNRLDRFSDAAADEDLPVLGLRTEPRGEVAYRADRGVARAFGKADLAQGRVTLRDTRAETKFAAMTTPNSN